jgi:hypothetical protein
MILAFGARRSSGPFDIICSLAGACVLRLVLGAQDVASGGEQRIVRITASLAAGHPASLRDTVPGLDQRALHLVSTAIRHAAGQRP